MPALASSVCCTAQRPRAGIFRHIQSITYKDSREKSGKLKCDGQTDGQTDRMTDRLTDSEQTKSPPASRVATLSVKITPNVTIITLRVNE